ncbi:hypothetical protein K7X08_000814 [Anisodus acutangulus]|uniref:Uncharacterized protein n=1 Tax=Anisodus acutangulus TaxID=402998 RepID=A0A9Q1MT57_9SOLA|nr:hypothetical protein K7X08_000814 [Anisodus acutangulus]
MSLSGDTAFMPAGTYRYTDVFLTLELDSVGDCHAPFILYEPILMFHSLITEFFWRAGVTDFPGDDWIDLEGVFHPLKVLGVGTLVKIKVDPNVSGDGDADDRSQSQSQSQPHGPFGAMGSPLQKIRDLVSRPYTRVITLGVSSYYFSRDEMK